jgi:hypothetical protein
MPALALSPDGTNILTVGVDTIDKLGHTASLMKRRKAQEEQECLVAAAK